jgi:hypothetical protein
VFSFEISHDFVLRKRIGGNCLPMRAFAARFVLAVIRSYTAFIAGRSLVLIARQGGNRIPET